MKGKTDGHSAKGMVVGVRPPGDCPSGGHRHGGLTVNERRLLDAALRFVAVADWFERLVEIAPKKFGDASPMGCFNRVDEQLRIMGRVFTRRGPNDRPKPGAMMVQEELQKERDEPWKAEDDECDAEDQ